MDYKRVLRDFENTTFGLELETCVHIIDNYMYTKLPIDEDHRDYEKILEKHVVRAIEQLYKCFKEKTRLFRWEMLKDSENRSSTYDSWLIMPDSSVMCSRIPEKYCILQGKYIKNKICEKFVFYPIEIVTPKLTGTMGIKIFTVVWQGIILSNDVVYSVNNSQGLHVNISHPKMDPTKFINLWIKHEHVLLQIIGSERRHSSKSMALPLTQALHSGLPIIELIKSKFIVVNLKKGKNKRLEVRLHEGTMDYNTIIKWTYLCMWLLCISLSYSEKDTDPILYPEMLSVEEKESLVNHFFNILYDTELIGYFEKLYNRNKSEDWPIVNYKGPSEKIIKYVSFTDFSRETVSNINKLKNKRCKQAEIDF